jgi:RimJ/RimL family protein N-acetyltransferase
VLRSIRILQSEFRNRSFSDFIRILFSAVFAADEIRIYVKELDSEKFSEVNCELQHNIIKGDLVELDDIRKEMESAPWEFSCHEYDGVKDFFMFKDDNHVIGHITWIYYKGDPSRDINLGLKEAELKYGLTHEKYRGKRLQPAALVECQKYLRANGYERVLTCVLENNHPSIKAVERAGFKLTKRKISVKLCGIRVTRRYSSISKDGKSGGCHD